MTIRKWEERAGLALVVAAFVAVLCALYCYSPTPSPEKIQAAAQRAASAIVTVEKADTALAQHEEAKASEAVRNGKRVAIGLRVVVSKTALDKIRGDTTVKASEVIVVADRVIALQDSLVASKDTTITELKKDNTRLAQALQTTRDTLAPYRTAIEPTTPPKPSLGSRLRKLAVVTVGGAAVYDGDSVTAGPGVVVGLHLTSGIVGVTAGVGVVQHDGMHFATGAAVGVGLRVHF